MKQQPTFNEVMRLVWSQSNVFIRVRLAAALFLVLLSGVLAPLGPVALKLIVDDLTGAARVGALSIATLGVLYVLSQWLSRSIGEIRSLVYSRAERRMFRTLSERLFTHVMHLPLRFHLERQTGAVTQALENGLQGYQRIVNQLAFTFVPVLVRLGTICAILVGFGHPMFLAIFCAAAVCYGAAFHRFIRQRSGLAKEASAARIDANAAMTDGIMNYETVKLFAAEEVIGEKVSSALLTTEDRSVRFSSFAARSGLTIGTIYTFFLALSLMLSVQEVRAGAMTIGDFILVNTFMLQVMQPVEQLGRAVQGLAEGSAMLDRMLALFREQPERGDAAAARQIDERDHLRGGTLEFRNVTASYRPDRATLSNISFVLPVGRTVGVVGASGAGKSTIVRLLVRLIEPDEGLILLNSRPISALALAELRRAIAVVPQDTVLFNDTLAYNIGFGRPGSSQQEIEEAARNAHLHDFIMSLPEGYETRVGERGMKLSGGERQRVSIARAALKRPGIYIFDEATSSLDSRTEREILGNLRELARRATTLIIAHRLSAVVHADEIVVVHGGTVAERGTHEQLLAREGIYAELWSAQRSDKTAFSVRA